MKKPEKQEPIKKKHTLPEAARKVMWKPGQSGNPAGRPKLGYSFAEQIRSIGDEVIDPKIKITRWQALIRAMFRKGIAGDVRAFEALAERGIGKVPMEILGDLSIVTPEQVEQIKAERWGAVVPAIAEALNEESDEQ